MTVLVIADHDNQTVRSTTLRVVAAATEIAGPTNSDIHILIVGYDASAAAAAASHISGVSKVICVDAKHLAHGLAENMADQVFALASSYSHFLFSTSSMGKGAAPRVAAKLDVGQISDVIKIQGIDTFERPIYAGSVITTVLSLDAKKVITIRTTAFEPATATGGSARIESGVAIVDGGKSKFESSEFAKDGRPELAGAKTVVAGGRALGSAEKFKELLTPLADVLEAALGASRAAVDAGYAPNDWQVGQTGKIVAPQLYIAVGISGAIQHLAGMKDAKVIVAINEDPDAPIFAVADYGLQANLFEAVPQLTNALEAIRK